MSRVGAPDCQPIAGPGVLPETLQPMALRQQARLAHLVPLRPVVYSVLQLLMGHFQAYLESMFVMDQALGNIVVAVAQCYWGFQCFW